MSGRYGLPLDPNRNSQQKLIGKGKNLNYVIKGMSITRSPMHGGKKSFSKPTGHYPKEKLSGWSK